MLTFQESFSGSLARARYEMATESSQAARMRSSS